MQVTLPSNIRIDPSQTTIKVNNQDVQATINQIAFIYDFPLPVGGQHFDVTIEGLKNPDDGPYDYSELQIVILDQGNYPIDRLIQI